VIVEGPSKGSTVHTITGFSGVFLAGNIALASAFSMIVVRPIGSRA